MSAISELINVMPEKTGVYQFFDQNNQLLYVGKAKNLKKRVNSYFVKKTYNKKTLVLKSKISNIKYIVVSSEVDALLLENNLIKKHQPKYNVLLKDDKTYPWICIKKENLPRVFRTRKIINDGSEYFGPYMSTHLTKLLLDYFSDLFYDSGWTPFSYLNRQLDQKTKEDYLAVIKEIRTLLKGGVKSLTNHLEKKMLFYAKNLEFEKAQKIKEKIVLLTNYQAKSSVLSKKIQDADVFSISNEEKYAYINYLKINAGAIVLSHTVEIRKKLNESAEELLALSIFNFRTRFHSKSENIYCSIKTTSCWENIKIHVPKIGDKKKLVMLSLKNAKQMQLTQAKIRANRKEKTKYSKSLKQLKKDLNLEELPLHIDCFDNSNLQGTNPVSACVVFKNGRPSKKEYRHFNIKTVVGPDDYASMKEVVFRKYHKAVNFPQLIIIDGGKGQLSAAFNVIKDLGLDKKIVVIAIAKKLETIYSVKDRVPLCLNKRSLSLKLIQHMRNEAHRFSLLFHRKKRMKKLTSNSLEKITGVGPKTIKILIKKYGSVKQVLAAEQKELEKIIGKNKAKKILKSNF